MFRKVLVTGADGFIGSHLTEALVRAGYDVRAFVIYNSFNSWGRLDHCPEGIKCQFEVFSQDRNHFGPQGEGNLKLICMQLTLER